jgi:hypothetical protein
MFMSEDEPRAVITRTGGRTQLKLINPDAAVSRIGVDVLAAFFKCFVAADRISTFEQMLVFNANSLPEDSVAYERNLRTIVFLLASTMYEAASALQELTSVRVIERMKDKTLWEPLNQLRGQWHKDHLASVVRNQLGHHLGQLDNYKKGVAQQAESVDLLVYAADDELRLSTAFPGAWDALFGGLEISQEEIESVISETQKGHLVFHDLIAAAFGEVVRTAGIDVQDDRQ